MARRIKKPNKPARAKTGVDLVPLPTSSRLAVVEVDYTNDVQLIDTISIKGAIVKPVVTYHESEDVSDKVERLMSLLGNFAAHVRPPEFHKIRVRRNRVEEGFGKNLTMREQAEAFVAVRPPKAPVEDVMAKVGGLLEHVEQSKQPTRTESRLFVVERLVVEGFMPFCDRQEIVLGDGVHAVVGGNRAGKSSLMDAVEFALTGKTGRKPRSNDKYVHHGCDGAKIQLDLEVDGEQFSVVRKIDDKGATTVDATGCKGGKVAEAEAVIQDRLGLSTEDLLFTCLVRQRELGGLLGQTSAPMQDALFRWLGVGAWADAEKLAGAEVARLQSKLVRLADKIADVEQRLVLPVPSEQEIDELRVALEAAKDHDKAADEAGKVLEEAKQRLDLFDTSKDLPRAEKLLAKQTEKVEQLTEAWEELRDAAAGYKKEYDDIAAIVQDGFDGACPVDGCECPRTDEINGGVKRLKDAERAARKAYMAAKQPADEARSKLRAAVNRRDDLEAVHEEAAEAAELFDGSIKRTTLVKDVGCYQKRLDKLTIDECVEVEDAQEEYEGALAVRAQRKRDLESKAEYEDKQAGAQEELAVMQYVKLLCSRQGVPAMIVEGAAGVIEQAANDTLERLGAPHRLEFTFETETKKPASVCKQCGADFPRSAKVRRCEGCGAVRGREARHELKPWISEGEGGHDYAMDSGGGQDLVALAVRVALSRFLGAKLLLIDEACANLDAVNVAAFTAMIARLRNVGFRQVLVSSHRQEVRDSTDRKVVVERSQGASTVTVEE